MHRGGLRGLFLVLNVALKSVQPPLNIVTQSSQARLRVVRRCALSRCAHALERVAQRLAVPIHERLARIFPALFVQIRQLQRSNAEFIREPLIMHAAGRRMDGRLEALAQVRQVHERKKTRRDRRLVGFLHVIPPPRYVERRGSRQLAEHVPTHRERRRSSGGDARHAHRRRAMVRAHERQRRVPPLRHELITLFT